MPYHGRSTETCSRDQVLGIMEDAAIKQRGRGKGGTVPVEATRVHSHGLPLLRRRAIHFVCKESVSPALCGLFDLIYETPWPVLDFLR